VGHYGNVVAKDGGVGFSALVEEYELAQTIAFSCPNELFMCCKKQMPTTELELLRMRLGRKPWALGALSCAWQAT
jgi:hypothetical protein